MVCAADAESLSPGDVVLRLYRVLLRGGCSCAPPVDKSIVSQSPMFVHRPQRAARRGRRPSTSLSSRTNIIFLKKCSPPQAPAAEIRELFHETLAKDSRLNEQVVQLALGFSLDWTTFPAVSVRTVAERTKKNWGLENGDLVLKLDGTNMDELCGPARRHVIGVGMELVVLGTGRGGLGNGSGGEEESSCPGGRW